MGGLFLWVLFTLYAPFYLGIWGVILVWGAIVFVIGSWVLDKILTHLEEMKRWKEHCERYNRDPLTGRKNR